MAESIVKVPQCATDDMDFLAFSFNGKHSWDDFGIYRVIDGDRYSENFSPTLNDKTAEVPGGDGMYYFGTTYKQRDFNISFAFDHLTEAKLREMKKWLNGKEMGDLWFSEAPYKVWTAKSSGNSAIKYIPFDDENGQRVYKGEGTIQFTAYWPYAHTPRGEIEGTFYSPKIEVTEEDNSKSSITFNITDKKTLQLLGKPGGIIYLDTDGTFDSWSFGDDKTGGQVEGYLTTEIIDVLDHNKLRYIVENPQNMTYTRLEITNAYGNGKNALAYFFFTNSEQFLLASGLNNNPQDGENPGDIPAPFILSQDEVDKDTEFKVGELSIKLLVDVYNLKWDSKTGIVSGTATSDPDSKRSAIPVEGNALGGIPVGGLTDDDLTLNDATLEYDYWYY